MEKCGIATQNVVERLLKEEGKTKNDIGQRGRSVKRSMGMEGKVGRSDIIFSFAFFFKKPLDHILRCDPARVSACASRERIFPPSSVCG